jgi:hypothetical protein
MVSTSVCIKLLTTRNSLLQVPKMVPIAPLAKCVKLRNVAMLVQVQIATATELMALTI